MRLINYLTNLQPRFNKKFNLESVEFILKHNTLTFEVQNYLEIQVPAMDTIFAPLYVSLTMGYI